MMTPQLDSSNTKAQPLFSALISKNVPSTALGTVRFGQEKTDKASLSGGLPKVAEPSMTRLKLEELKEAYEKEIIVSEGKIPALMSWSSVKLAFHHLRLIKKLNNVLENEGKKWLPEANKKRLTQYRWGFFEGGNYFVDKLFREKGFALRKNATIEGPISVKEKQAFYQKNKVSLEGFKMMVEMFTSETIDKIPEGEVKGWQKGLLKLSAPIIRFFVRRQINKLEQYKALLGDLPVFDKKEADKTMQAVVKGYNQAHSDNSIQGTPEILKAASVGITYKAKFKEGSLGIIKVVRPEHSLKTMGEYKNYLYFVNMVNMGTTPKQKKEAHDDASQRVDFLKLEITPQHEAQRIKEFSQDLKDQDIQSFKSTTLLFSETNGLITTFDGDKTYGSLSLKEQTEVVDGKRIDLLTMPERMHYIHADLHDDNAMVRVSETNKELTLIDFGRTLKIDPEINQALVNLSTLSMSIDDFEGLSYLFKMPEMFGYLETLTKGTAYEKSVATVKNYYLENSGSIDRPYDDIEKIENLLGSLLNNNDELFNEKVTDKEKIKEGSSTYSQNKVLYPWYNYMGHNNMAESADKLNPLALEGVPISELRDIRTKNMGFYASLFLTPLSQYEGEKREITLASAQKISSMEDLETFDWTFAYNIKKQAYLTLDEKIKSFKDDFQGNLQRLKEHLKDETLGAAEKSFLDNLSLETLSKKSVEELQKKMNPGGNKFKFGRSSSIASYITSVSFKTDDEKLEAFRARIKTDRKLQNSYLKIIAKEKMLLDISKEWAEKRLALPNAPKLSDEQQKQIQVTMAKSIKEEFHEAFRIHDNQNILG